VVVPNFARLIYTNLKGPLLSNKIIVLESDDWGAVRSSSARALTNLKTTGVKVDDCHYTKYDALASKEDLEALFYVLNSVRNSAGESPKITANTLVANPNFEKIAQSSFEQYYWEDFRETLKRYPQHSNSFSLWQEGMEAGIFHPQFHGREHLNISRWMKALQAEDKITRKAFDLGIYGVSGHIIPSKRASHLAAFDGGVKELIFSRAEIVKVGLQQFKEIFGYSSQSMIAPNYVWDDEIEQAAFNEGVKYLQSSTAQRVSNDFDAPQQIIRHYGGQKNVIGQRYLLRNCHFEPSSNPNKDWVDSCLNEIKIAFTMRKPAIISTHRVNFIGFIDAKNRDNNLPKLKSLLSQIVKKWPDVVFMTSDQLGVSLDKHSSK
jgi:hypothetical protein